MDPDDPEAFITLAHALLHDGRPAEAAAAVETAMRLDPDYPPRYLYWLGMAKFHLEEFEEAAALLASEVARNPKGMAEGCYTVLLFECLSSIAPLVATYGYLGRDGEAGPAIAAWTQRFENRFGVAPTLARARSHWDHFRHPGYLERLLGGLRKAGLPPVEERPWRNMATGFAAAPSAGDAFGATAKPPTDDS